MDEAERCDKIVYISAGRVVTRGTVREVIEQSGLVTFVIGGPDVRRFIPQLEGAPGVEHVAFFGALLHVSGYDRNLLSAALAPLKNISGLEISETAPSLEDVFIDLQRPRRQAA